MLKENCYLTQREVLKQKKMQKFHKLCSLDYQISLKFLYDEGLMQNIRAASDINKKVHFLPKKDTENFPTLCSNLFLRVLQQNKILLIHERIQGLEAGPIFFSKLDLDDNGQPKESKSFFIFQENLDYLRTQIILKGIRNPQKNSSFFFLTILVLTQICFR